VAVLVGDVVVVDRGPGEADDLVLGEDGLDGALRALGAGVVEGCDPELEHEAAGLAGLGVEAAGGVGPGDLFDPGGAPSHAPVFADGGCEE
jgi:hypothetical protein